MPSPSKSAALRRRTPTPVPETFPSDFSPVELTHVILDCPSVEMINNTITDTTDAAHLRHYSYVAHTMKRLEYELDQHRQEQNELFDHMTANERFRGVLAPIIHNYRQRTRQSGFHPYSQRLLTPPTPPARYSLPPSSSNSSNESIYSAQTNETGASQNPIDVDNIDETKNTQPKHESRCKRCDEEGHDRNSCNTKMFKPRCGRCKQHGHRKRHCDAPTTKQPTF